MTRRRSAIVLAAGVLLGAVGYWAIEIRTRTGAERVKHMIDWDDTCKSVEVQREVDHIEYLRDWRHAEERAMVICHMLGGSIAYARFRDAAAATRTVSASPPVWHSCLGGRRELYARARGGREYRVRCRRDRGALDEWTERYCLAGDEVVVDNLDEDGEFRKLCRELDGRLLRPSPSVLERR